VPKVTAVVRRRQEGEFLGDAVPGHVQPIARVVAVTRAIGHAGAGHSVREIHALADPVVDVGGAADDADGDGVPDLGDLCPTLADPDQADADGDGVGDACDTCTDVANPRIDSPPPAPFTTTGGQRDDDADGIGNACDAQVMSAGALVSDADWIEFKASFGRSRTAMTCGTGRDLPCAVFDLDGVGLVINAADFNRAKAARGRAPGPRCAACGDFARIPCEGPACPAP